MKLQFGGKCSRCGKQIPKGDEADYDREARTVSHYQCPGEETGETPEDLAARLGYWPSDRVDRDWALLFMSWQGGKPPSEPNGANDAALPLFDSVP